jgi:pseudouridine-5'-phosphate glycosidase
VNSSFVLGADVAEALMAGGPVVALESTIISHGLPHPENIRVAHHVHETVRARGATPATIAILDGQVRVGLSDDQIAEVGSRDDVIKASVRDLMPLLSRGGNGSTTVASTSLIAVECGITVFATGGLGGVHRHARDSWDESADLTTLSSTPITIVCSGVKSILDVAATLERLETLNVTVVGYQTSRFPGFYLSDSGHDVTWTVQDPAEVAAMMRARTDIGVSSALIVGNPIPVTAQLDPDLHDAVLADGLSRAQERGISGKDVTPFLLDHFHRATHGASLTVNSDLIVDNADLAARIAVAASG